jgi:hypothetical protein
MVTSLRAAGAPSILPYEGQYWLAQVIGWAALALLSYLSLTLWYNPGELIPAVHTVLQSALGLLVSHPLRFVARWAWSKKLAYRLAINAAGVALAALAWTALRLKTFTWLTGERVNPGDWGGWMFASVMVFGSWLFCYHAVKFYRQSIEQRERAQKEQLKRFEAEALFQEAKLRMLKYQLNPHFLFNALNSVAARVHKGDQSSAALMLTRISGFLRLSLEQDDRLQHELADEEEMVRLYLEIEEARFGDRLRTKFEIDEDAFHAIVPTLLLQPLVENAIKHGVGRSLEPTSIYIGARKDRTRLLIEVTNTGSNAQIAHGRRDADREGIGLKNVEERLRSTFEDDYILQLDEIEPQGFSVKIDVPFRTDDLAEDELRAAE